MGDGTSIQWADSTWNPIVGCSVVSPGCKRCYAMREAYRFGFNKKLPQYAGLTEMTKGGPVWTGKVAEAGDRILTAPLRWKRPRKIFVNSMGDLFHESITDEQIDKVYAVMAMCPQHKFLILTKRPDRQRDYLVKRMAGDGMPWAEAADAVADAAGIKDHPVVLEPGQMPLPNVWNGTSVEDQTRAEERLPHLVETPSAVLWVSAEPMLGGLDLRKWMWPVHPQWPMKYRTPEEAIADGAEVTYHRQALVAASRRFIKWVVIGGESGSGARYFHIPDARRLITQCRRSGTAVYVKQLGARPHEYNRATLGPLPIALKHKKGGDPDEWPEDLRVREYPA